MVAILDSEDVLKGQSTLISLLRLEVLILEKSLGPFFLLGFEASFVLEPEPVGFLEVGLREDLSLSRSVYGLVDEFHEVKSIRR